MTVRILRGDCRDVLPTLPAESVHCVVTSPPYFGLRDYGVAGQIGLEANLAAFIDEMVTVFRQVSRVLRRDGTCWCNIGDSFAGSWGAQGRRETESDDPAWRGNSIKNHPRRASNTGSIRDAGLKPKDLMLVPHRLAIALQQDGWWVRQDIIWAKPSPMPESVTDRPTVSHEHVLLLARSARYFYDADAVREMDAGQDHPRNVIRPPNRSGGFSGDDRGIRTAEGRNGLGRNLRDVWTISSSPFPEAHFATFPPKLVEPCILAGTSAHGCCPACGAPWTRVVTKGEPDLAHQRASGGNADGEYHGQSTKDHAAAGVQDASAVKARILAGMVKKQTTGWRPTCDCPELRAVPCTVLDPFGGAGTTGLVADRLGRDAVLIELNPSYASMAGNRIRRDSSLLGQVELQEASDG